MRCHLEISRTLLQEQYCLYMIELLIPSEKPEYYIGITGDRRHPVPNSPFMRLINHFNMGNKRATDNQIARHLGWNRSNLGNYAISYWVYPYGAPAQGEEHRQAVKDLELVEAEVDALFGQGGRKAISSPSRSRGHPSERGQRVIRMVRQDHGL